MKHLVSILLGLIYVLQIQAQQVEIKSSRLHGLLVFVYSNMNRPHYSPYLKEYTEKSEYADQMKAIFSDYADVDRDLNTAVNYSQNIKGYGDGFGVDDLFEIQSAYAEDIDDLFTRLQTTMPMDTFLKFKKMVKLTEPIYEKLIWKPQYSKLSEIEGIDKENAKKWKLSELFETANHFYGTAWPKEQEFLIALYPIPPGKKHSNAHSLGPFESVGTITDAKDHAGRFSVAFHEMMHSLYSAQPTEFKKELLSYYELDKKDADLPYRAGAQKFANEVFATALGNGWFYEVVTGAQDKASWYNDAHIETMARAMYDLTKTYLQQKKRIDKEYIKQYVASFKIKFPDYPEEKDYIFQELDVFHSGDFFESPDIRKSFRSVIRSGKLGITSTSTLFKQKLEIENEHTNLFLVSNREVARMNIGFRNQIGLPKKIQAQILKGKTGMWKWTDKNKNLRAIAVVKDGELSNLFKQGFGAY